jgi:uncharacterized protein YxeA
MFNEEYAIRIIVIMILMIIAVGYFMKNITTGSDKK